MRYEDFISRFEKVKKTTKGVMVKCPAHDDGTASLHISPAPDGGILLKDFAGCDNKAIVAALGLTMKDLFAGEPFKKFVPPPTKNNGNNHADAEVKPTIEKIYPYHDAAGKLAFEVVRLNPKSFRQRHKDANNNWVWSMDGVTRCLYRLPDVLAAKEVWITEGERDADTLADLGFVATCNVGGAGKWLDGYTESLKGKQIVLCGDNDEPGQKHVDLVFDSIAKSAKRVRKIALPKEYKDVSEFCASFDDKSKAKSALESLRDAAHPFVRGVSLPIYSMSEIEPIYSRHSAIISSDCLNLASWLPSLRRIRPLVPGELVVVVGDTGTGKTAILQSLALAALPLPTVLFELELPLTLLFERFMASRFKFTCQQVEDAFRNGETFGERMDEIFRNLYVCAEPKLDLAEIERIVVRSELKIGVKPKLVLIDYLQLLHAIGPNRREKTSDLAEGLKVLAKATNTIVVVSSQVRRPSDDSPEVTLHSAKESGSIESSCGLLIGAWRDEADPALMYLRILKSTKGGAGLTVNCNFDGQKMMLTERSCQ